MEVAILAGADRHSCASSTVRSPVRHTGVHLWRILQGEAFGYRHPSLWEHPLYIHIYATLLTERAGFWQVHSSMAKTKVFSLTD